MVNIQEAIEQAQTREEQELAEKADKNCNKCYGRGQTGFNTKRNAYVICKCTLPKEEKPVEKKKDEGQAGFNAIQVGTIKRIRSDISVESDKRDKLLADVAGNETALYVEEQEVAVAEEQKVINALRNTAKKKREKADLEQERIDSKQAMIERLQREIKAHNRDREELIKLATSMEKDAHRKHESSRCSGEIQRLSQLQKRLHRETHRSKKKAREAQKRIDKLEAKLDAQYPGHEAVK